MRRFEAFLDDKGHYVAGKSTIVVRSIEGRISLMTLVGILNSQLIRFYLQECFGVLGVDGGISFSGKIVKSIPLPNEFNGKLPCVEATVRSLLEHCVEAKPSDTAIAAVNEAVFDAYEIADSERQMIRNYEFQC
jgi:hypothetical protein